MVIGDPDFQSTWADSDCGFALRVLVWRSGMKRQGPTWSKQLGFLLKQGPTGLFCFASLVKRVPIEGPADSSGFQFEVGVPAVQESEPGAGGSERLGFHERSSSLGWAKA